MNECASLSCLRARLQMPPSQRGFKMLMEMLHIPTAVRFKAHTHLLPFQLASSPVQTLPTCLSHSNACWAKRLKQHRIPFCYTFPSRLCLSFNYTNGRQASKHCCFDMVQNWYWWSKTWNFPLTTSPKGLYDQPLIQWAFITALHLVENSLKNIPPALYPSKLSTANTLEMTDVNNSLPAPE